MLVGVVLAGGLSTRMGTDKAGLRHPGSGLSLVQHARLTLVKAGADAAVTSSNKLPGMLADNYAHLGPLSGIHAAFTYCAKTYPSSTGLLFLPVDMPNITSTLLVSLYKQGKAQAKACFYGRQFLPLYLPFTMAYIEYLEYTLASRQNTSLKAMLNGPLGAVQLDIPTGSENADAFININQPNQWAAFQHTQLKTSSNH